MGFKFQTQIRTRTSHLRLWSKPKSKKNWFFKKSKSKFWVLSRFFKPLYFNYESIDRTDSEREGWRERETECIWVRIKESMRTPSWWLMGSDLLSLLFAWSLWEEGLTRFKPLTSAAHPLGPSISSTMASTTSRVQSSAFFFSLSSIPQFSFGALYWLTALCPNFFLEPFVIFFFEWEPCVNWLLWNLHIIDWLQSMY